MEESRTLLASGGLEGAASRLYYSAFHASRAALLVRGLSSKTHSGQIAMFTEAFGPAPLMARLLELRARADYGLGRFSMSVAALESEVGDTAEFLERCRRIVVAAEAGGADEQDPPADY